MMLLLTRQFRFYRNSLGDPRASKNAWAGYGGGFQANPFLQLECSLRGELNRVSGYLCDIKQIDDACRAAILQVDRSDEAGDGRDSLESPRRDLIDWLIEMGQSLPSLLPSDVALAKLRLRLSPGLSLHWEHNMGTCFSVTQQFEFSAAHRLHCREWTDAENRQAFGKCNHVHGHGHNYVVEVTVAGDRAKVDQRQTLLSEIDRVVARQVIEKVDHKFLNLDVAEFKELNPSVENIAQVIWGWLDGQFADVQLSNVRVYETAKTWADVSRS